MADPHGGGVVSSLRGRIGVKLRLLLGAVVIYALFYMWWSQISIQFETNKASAAERLAWAFNVSAIVWTQGEFPSIPSGLDNEPVKPPSEAKPQDNDRDPEEEEKPRPEEEVAVDAVEDDEALGGDVEKDNNDDSSKDEETKKKKAKKQHHNHLHDVGGEEVDCPHENQSFKAERIGPVVTMEMKHMDLGVLEGNVNGPSVLHVPEWVEKPLGKYYLYFGHHLGHYIRLAYSDELNGTWTLHEGGCLDVDDAPGAIQHVASPEVVVDHANQVIRMYFHGLRHGEPAGKSWKANSQVTFVSFSNDGLLFNVSSVPLSLPYLRVFQYRDYYYGIVKDTTNGGLLVRSKDGVTPFEAGPTIIPKMRHAAVLLCGDVLYIFFTRLWDKPERILYTTIQLNTQGTTDDNYWLQWKESESLELLRPETNWEGAHLPVVPGEPGALTHEVHALRDPAIFYEAETQISYLFYSVKGESGIGLARLVITDRLEPE